MAQQSPHCSSRLLLQHLVSEALLAGKVASMQWQVPHRQQRAWCCSLGVHTPSSIKWQRVTKHQEGCGLI